LGYEEKIFGKKGILDGERGINERDLREMIKARLNERWFHKGEVRISFVGIKIIIKSRVSVAQH